jgi:putative membrane protein
MNRLFVRWLVLSAAIAIVAWLLPGIRAGSGMVGAVTVCITAAFLGFANAVVKPILTLLSCPMILLTLGLFLIVINAAMLQLAAWATRIAGYPLEVDGWGTAIIGSIAISIVTWLLSLFVRDDKSRSKRDA